MEVLLVVLGAVLALAGGLVAQAIEDAAQQAREERDILFEMDDTVREMSTLLKQYGYRDIRDDESAPVSARLEMLNSIDRLARAAVRIRSRKNRDIAIRLVKVAFNAPLRTRDNLFALNRQIQLRLNGDVVERYERECREQPELF